MSSTVEKKTLVRLLKTDIASWKQMAGGPNMDAFKFDPEEQDTEELERLGYYDNPTAWIAGVQVKALQAYLASIED